MAQVHETIKTPDLERAFAPTAHGDPDFGFTVAELSQLTGRSPGDLKFWIRQGVLRSETRHWGRKPYVLISARSLIELAKKPRPHPNRRGRGVKLDTKRNAAEPKLDGVP